MTRELPADAVEYKRTRVFDEHTVPAGLLADHATRAGVWGRIEVELGELGFRIDGGLQVLTPDRPGIIPPEEPHEVVLRGPVRFQVVFLR